MRAWSVCGVVCLVAACGGGVGSVPSDNNDSDASSGSPADSGSVGLADAGAPPITRNDDAGPSNGLPDAGPSASDAGDAAAIGLQLQLVGDTASGFGTQTLVSPSVEGGHYPGTANDPTDPESSAVGTAVLDAPDRKHALKFEFEYAVFGAAELTTGSYSESSTTPNLTVVQVTRGALPDDPTQAGFASTDGVWFCCKGDQCPLGQVSGTFSLSVTSVSPSTEFSAPFDRGLTAHGSFHGQCVPVAGVSPDSTAGVVTVDFSF